MLTMTTFLVLNAINEVLAGAAFAALITAVFFGIRTGIAYDTNPSKELHYSADKDEHDCAREQHAALCARLLRRAVLAVAGFVGLMTAAYAFPNGQEVLEAKMKTEAAKVLTADTAQKVAEELLRRVDKAIDAVGKE